MAVQSKSEVLTLHLTDQRPSNFVLEGTENTPFEIRLRAPGYYAILPKSIMMVNGKRTPIRYIKGCDIIDVEEQKKQGYVPNPYEDQVVFKHGLLVVVNDGMNTGLYEYLKNCEFNLSNESRPKHAQSKFMEFKPEKKAVFDILKKAKMRQAQAMVSDLYSYNEKEKEMNYDEERINFLGNLFNIAQTSPAEMVNALDVIATGTPDIFLESVANRGAETKVIIAESIKNDIISINGDKAIFVNGGKVILLFKSAPKDKEGKVTELAEYLLTAKGELDYTQIQIQNRVAKSGLAAKA